MYNPQTQNQIVSFYDRDILSKFKTREEGKPVYITKVYVKIDIPFKEKDSINRPMQEKDMAKYPQQWEAYQSREKYEMEGTVIENWNYLDESQIKMLKSAGIKTVEQVGAVDDNTVKRLGSNGRRMRDMAIKFVAQGDAVDLRKQLDEVKKELAELTADKKPKKKKEVIDDTPNSNSERSE